MAHAKNKCATRSNLAYRLLTGVFLGANAFTVLLLWASAFSTYVSPAHIPWTSLLGLLFPFFMLADIVFVFLWLLFKARMVWLPLLGLLAVQGYVRDYCPVSLKEEIPDSSLCVMSYNIGGVSAGETDILDSLVRNVRPDILCLQECNGNTAAKLLDRWKDILGYDMREAKGRTVFSRFSFLGDTLRTALPSRTGFNGAMACWLSLGGDSLLVVNAHLESNSLTTEDKTEYKLMITEHQKEQIKHGGMLLTDKLTTAARYRALQTDSIVQLVRRHEDKETVVCGDFNDTPISYAFQSMSRRLRSAYTEKGNGISISFNQTGFYVRIDHIFHSSGLLCTKCYIDDSMAASDHYPIVAYLCRKQP